MPTAVRLKTTADTPVAGMPARVVICTEVVDPAFSGSPLLDRVSRNRVGVVRP